MLYYGTMYTSIRALFWGEKAYLTYWYAFLFSFPFSWRQVLIPSVTGGPFNEYMDISLYVGDILILSSIILIIKHNITYKSILSKLKMFHVEHWLMLTLVFYLTLSILWSEDWLLWMDGTIGFIRIITILSIFVFSLKQYQSKNDCSTWNNIKWLTFIIAFSVSIQAIIGIAQFIHNGSIGLSLLGESEIAENILGVAKIDFETYKQIRAYGTFLHPNILGGYLVFSIVFLGIFWRKFRPYMFHVEQLLIKIAILLGLIALALTFSKSALFAFVLLSGIYLFHVEQVKPKKMFHVEHLVLVLSIVSLVLVVFISGKNQLIKSIDERIQLVQINTIYNEEWLIGKGLNQSIYNLYQQNFDRENWQLQPIHNIYLNIISDVGIFGLLLIIFVLIKYIGYVPRGTFLLVYGPLLVIGIVGIFDHYPWDIYAGQILLSLAIGWVLAYSRYTIDNSYN